MSGGADGRGWLHPFWWERQTDPTGPAFVPMARPAGVGKAPVVARPVPDLAGVVAPVNVTHREVSVTGTLGTRDVALVDPRGSVQLDGRSWSLDWLIGADDGWHAPARVGAVRQIGLEATPVIETRVRVPGGDVVQRVFAARAVGVGDVVVVEVHNATPVAMGVAFAIRPFTGSGLGSVGTVDLDGLTVSVDGEPVAVLPKAPGRWAGGSAVVGDSATAVLAGLAVEPPFVRVDCPQGLANAAFVLPVPHTATTRVLLPLNRAPETGRGGATNEPVVVGAVPAAESVAAGWVEQLGRSVRLGLPAGVLADRARTALASVLLAAGDEDLRLVPERRPEPAEEALLLGALDAFGLHEESERVLATLEERLALDGYLGDRSGHWDANGALLAALGAHCRLCGDDDLARTLVGPLAKAAHWAERRRHPRRSRNAPRVPGMLPDGPGPRWAGGEGAWFRDLAWTTAGLREAARLLGAVDQPEAAAEVDGLHGLLEEFLLGAIGDAAGSCGGALPPQPELGIDHRVPASLESLVLLPSIPTSIAAATLEAVGALAVADGLVLEPATGGPSPLLTGWLALADAAHRPHRAPTHVQMLAGAGAGAAAAAWPEVLHPRTRGGAAGDPWHPPSAAMFLLSLRRLLIAERSAGCWWEPDADPVVMREGAPVAVLDLLPALPADWLGTPVEVHGLPTGIGTVSFAMRWHGPRPALLWEITPRDGAGQAPLLRSSLLDPTWEASGWTGEALLAAPPEHGHDLHDGHDHGLEH